jgi:signal transduction histidine kinase
MLLGLHQLLDIELAIMLDTYRQDLLSKNMTAERLATVGQFAAGIGHELRNPLGVMESSVFLMRRRLEQLKLADAVLDRHLDKIGREIERSTKTISDLLDLARSRSPNRRHVDARQFVTNALAAAHLSADVEIAIDVPEGLVVDADPDQLTRVMTNLLANASQAMKGKGRISIEGCRDGGSTVLRVSDEGPGVAVDLRDRIFEALFTTKAKGTGLGLALCRRIAEAHGGTVLLEATDHGATFRLTIPDPTPGLE